MAISIDRCARMADQSAKKMLEKVRRFLRLDKMPPKVRKAVVVIVGGILFVAGIAMVIAPGPAFVFVPLGLLLLATEFKWAERAAQKVIDGLSLAREKWREFKRKRKRRAA